MRQRVSRYTRERELHGCLEFTHKQEPHTRRLTLMSLDTFLMSGRTSSSALLMDSKDSDVALSPVYLHLHSLQTWSNDMAPFARSTMFKAEEWTNGVAEGANAKALLREARTKATVFMVKVCDGYCRARPKSEGMTSVTSALLTIIRSQRSPSHANPEVEEATASRPPTWKGKAINCHNLPTNIIVVSFVR